jgi:hypothetical protein
VACGGEAKDEGGGASSSADSSASNDADPGRVAPAPLLPQLRRDPAMHVLPRRRRLRRGRGVCPGLGPGARHWRLHAEALRRRHPLPHGLHVSGFVMPAREVTRARDLALARVRPEARRQGALNLLPRCLGASHEFTRTPVANLSTATSWSCAKKSVATPSSPLVLSKTTNDELCQTRWTREVSPKRFRQMHWTNNEGSISTLCCVITVPSQFKRGGHLGHRDGWNGSAGGEVDP